MMIGLLAMIALALALLCVLVFVIVRALWRHASEGRASDRGGDDARHASRMPDPDGSDWWVEFERGFAEHVAGQRSRRSGRRSG